MTRISRRKINLYRHGLRRAVARYLHERFGRRLPVSASGFAQYVELTPSYLSRIAPEVLGVSLQELLREQQLERAAELLRRFDLSVQEVALRSGFRSTKTLYRLFRARYGMPPGQYREDKK